MKVWKMIWNSNSFHILVMTLHNIQDTMTPQEALTDIRKQFNELREQANKDHRDHKIEYEQLELRRQMNGHIDCYCIDCINPLTPPPPDPCPVDPPPRQVQQTLCPVDHPLQQTHLPLDPPARESSIANIRSLDSFYLTDDDLFSSTPTSNIKYAPSTISTRMGYTIGKVWCYYTKAWYSIGIVDVLEMNYTLYWNYNK